MLILSPFAGRVEAGMQTSYIVMEYLYRDGDGFITHGRLLLIGQDERAERIIRQCLEWGEQFVAEQVGVPSLCGTHWAAVGEGPSVLDHAFHEFVRLRHLEEGERVPPVWGSLDELVRRMQGAAGRWSAAL